MNTPRSGRHNGVVTDFVKGPQYGRGKTAEKALTAGLAAHAALDDFKTVGSSHACLRCWSSPVVPVGGNFFRRLRRNLLRTFEQGPGVSSGVGVRAARGRDDFPCRTRVGTPLPFHLARKQIQKIVHLRAGLTRDLNPPRPQRCRCRELRRNCPGVPAATGAPTLTSGNLRGLG
jgi:hypothetical protein